MASKKTVVWSPVAQTELRAIDRETALRILRAIDHYLTTGAGDVIKLQPPGGSSSAFESATSEFSFSVLTPTASKFCVSGTALRRISSPIW